jgi:sn-glycerol 3-phosphate transport system substrate-binding protein
MKWTMMAAALAVCLTAPLAKAMAEAIELQWWHAMTAVNADRVNKIAADFNASQEGYRIVPVFKGSYGETMNAGVAAYRAGNAPHIIQIFEVGTATMMAAKGAVKPVYQLMAEAGEPFDPNAYLPAVTAYYSTVDGKMLSLPLTARRRLLIGTRMPSRRPGSTPIRPPRPGPTPSQRRKSCVPLVSPAA